MFLALACFGTDQPRVQRYVTGKSIAGSRRGLLFNAVAKIPMQLFMLFIGALVCVFYIYQAPPLLFERNDLARIQVPQLQGECDASDLQYRAAYEDRRRAAAAPGSRPRTAACLALRTRPAPPAGQRRTGSRRHGARAPG